jgi:myosin heavy subunit
MARTMATDRSSNVFLSFSLLQVLFRSGVLNQLEAKRDELLSDRIIQLQAFCRGYLARRRVGQRRVQVSRVRLMNDRRVVANA